MAPRGRSFKEWEKESRAHGWPSFRDAEVVWDDVRVLPSTGECVSLVGTHLGHNLPAEAGEHLSLFIRERASLTVDNTQSPEFIALG